MTFPLERQSTGISVSAGFGALLQSGELTRREVLSVSRGHDGSASTVGVWLWPAMMLISPVGRRCLRLQERVAPSVRSPACVSDNAGFPFPASMVEKTKLQQHLVCGVLEGSSMFYRDGISPALVSAGTYVWFSWLLFSTDPYYHYHYHYHYHIYIIYM